MRAKGAVAKSVPRWRGGGGRRRDRGRRRGVAPNSRTYRRDEASTNARRGAAPRARAAPGVAAGFLGRPLDDASFARDDRPPSDEALVELELQSRGSGTSDRHTTDARGGREVRGGRRWRRPRPRRVPPCRSPRWSSSCWRRCGCITRRARLVAARSRRWATRLARSSRRGSSTPTPSPHASRPSPIATPPPSLPAHPRRRHPHPASPLPTHRRYTKDRARFTEPTEIILYLCKEFWPDVFKKRVDNLKTNNRGVYVLTDNAFRWVRHLHAVGSSREAGEAAKREYAETCARFPAGVVRGALANLGAPCVVVAECDPPSCVFTVRLRGAAP